ncbi:MAG: sugar transferase [Candidatus Omnitrophica bacterium]|nr:sugar transferase [Candidatus Omnitrophota bacterium]
MKRIFDIFGSLLGLLVFAPLLLIVGILIKLTSKGPVIFSQVRTGLNEKAFYVYKFRTMVNQADKIGSSVTTGKDPRITPVGRILRRIKFDELPQLYNVLKGDMSFVGPRPDVPEITMDYTTEMKRVLQVRPGITSVATLHFRNEEELLAKVSDPNKFYEEIVVPLKVELTMEHVRNNSFLFDFKILLQTIWMLTPLGKVWPIKEHEVVKTFKEKYSL